MALPVRCVFLLWAGLALSCADAAGTDPYGMWDTFVDPNGAYTFRYLSPPWELVSESDATPVIAVDPTRDEVDDSVTTGALQARFKAVVSVRADTAEDAAGEDAALLLDLGAESVATMPFKSDGGRAGYQVAADLPDRHVRAVYQDLPEGGAAVLQVVGRDGVDDEDFTLLLRGLEPTSAEVSP